MALTPATAIEAARKLAAAVETILSFKDELSAKPDVAAKALGAVLTEIAKTHMAVDEAVKKYVNVPTDRTAFDHGIKPLLDLTGGVLEADVMQARGHCHQIGPIYFDHLKRWFARALAPTEQLLLENIFFALGGADFGLFDELASVTKVLESGADEAIILHKQQGPDAARARIEADSTELMQLRRELSRMRTSLHSLELELRGFVPGNAPS